MNRICAPPRTMPFSPAVRLSPKAVKRVPRSIGIACTSVTEKWDAAVRTPSVAVQVTTVVPIGNIEPDAGRQVTVIGGEPPVATGASKVTAIDEPGTFAI